MRRLLAMGVRARPTSTRLKAAFVKVPAAGSRPIRDVRAKLGHTAAAADEDATPRTAETWRAGFDESLGQLQQHRSWGRSQGVQPQNKPQGTIRGGIDDSVARTLRALIRVHRCSALQTHTDYKFLRAPLAAP